MKKTLLFSLLSFIITFTGCKNNYKLPESSVNESTTAIVSEDTHITIPDIFDIDEISDDEFYKEIKYHNRGKGNFGSTN